MNQKEVRLGYYRLKKDDRTLEAQRSSGRYAQVFTLTEGANAAILINWGSNYLVEAPASALEPISAAEAARVEEVFSHLADFPELTRIGERLQAAYEEMELYFMDLVGTPLIVRDFKSADDLLRAAAQDMRARGIAPRPKSVEGLRKAWEKTIGLLADLDQLEAEIIRKAAGQAA